MLQKALNELKYIPTPQLEWTALNQICARHNPVIVADNKCFRSQVGR